MDLVTPGQLADRLGIPEATLAYWRSMGNGPPWGKFGRHVRYPADQLDTWIADRVGAPRGGERVG